jgi:hypothetical protein
MSDKKVADLAILQDVDLVIDVTPSWWWMQSVPGIIAAVKAAIATVPIREAVISRKRFELRVSVPADTNDLAAFRKKLVDAITASWSPA